MKNLVTGGAGFLGSHLIDNLINKNEKVICLDNYYTGTSKNIEKWLNHPNFKLIEHEPEQLLKELEQQVTIGVYGV